MYWIHSASSISHQPSFYNKGFSEHVTEINFPSQIIHPEYKKYIPVASLRRMGDVLRLSAACSQFCLQDAGVNNPEAIIVGTGLGCLNDTEKFLNHIFSVQELIPPTSFIQSTHNTIAGQIALLLKNHNYNMTHTQNSLSFEYALIDAMLCLDEGKKNVLVGAADEYIDILSKISKKIMLNDIHLTTGASFFVLSKSGIENKNIAVTNIAANGLFSSILECIQDFFTTNDIALHEIDLILFSSLQEEIKKEIASMFVDRILIDYAKYSGYYFTNSAFALHLATDFLENGTNNSFGNYLLKKPVKQILICNNLNPKNLGLIIVKKNEA